MLQNASWTEARDLLLGLAKQAAAILGEDYDVDIVEMHHRHKRDAPSGTALALARAVADGRGVDLDALATYGRRGLSDSERPHGEIAIHALRGGETASPQETRATPPPEQPRRQDREREREREERRRFGHGRNIVRVHRL